MHAKGPVGLPLTGPVTAAGCGALTGWALTCCTVAANIADTSGNGVFSDASAGNGPEIENSLFGDNDGHDLYGKFYSADYNLIQNTLGCTLTGPTGNNVTGQDPLLMALASNGGPTKTMAIEEGSPARDQGSCSCDEVDQRGVARPYGSGACDIGAYERTSQTLVELASFAAEGLRDRVVLTWQTASEINNAGFYVWRRTCSQGEYIPITDVMIPAEGGSTQGASYAFEDRNVSPGRTYFYKLEDMNTSGLSTFHGPASAWAGVVNIAVSGADGPATVPVAQPVSVKVSVQPEEGASPQEWWLCCESPFGWFSYINPKGWVPGIEPAWVTSPGPH